MKRIDAAVFGLALVIGAATSNLLASCGGCPNLPPYPTGDYQVVASTRPWQVGLIFHFERTFLGKLTISYTDEDGAEWVVTY